MLVPTSRMSVATLIDLIQAVRNEKERKGRQAPFRHRLKNTGLSDVGLISGFGGGLKRSTQHFILNGKDGVYGDEAKISSRVHCGREDGVVGSLAARGVAESDWASVW